MKAGSKKKLWNEWCWNMIKMFFSRESNDLWVEIWWHTFVYLFREKPSLLFTLSSLVRPFTLGTHEAHTARGGFNKSWIHHPLFGYMIFTNMEKLCGFTVTKNSEFLRGPKKNGLRKQHIDWTSHLTSFDYTWSWDRLPLVHWNPTLHNHEGFLFWIKVWSKRQWKGTHVAM